MLSCVCHSWHYAATTCNWVKLRENWSHHMPWLMLTDGNDKILAPHKYDVNFYDPGELEFEEDTNCIVREAESAPEKLYNKRIFLNLRLNKCYEFNCPQGYGRVCWWSPYGWIATTGLDHDMYMFNPLTRSRLDLPSRKTIPLLWKGEAEIVRYSFINKIVVLKVPSDIDSPGAGAEELLVVVIYELDYDKVVIAKPGDTRWTELDTSAVQFTYLMDVLYHNDLGLVFVSEFGGVIHCKLWDKEKPLLLKWFRPNLSSIVEEFKEGDLWAAKTYIVNCGSDLLMILRTIDTVTNCNEDITANCPGINGYKTTDFEVFKLDFHTKDWKEVRDLQGVAIFVGNNATMALPALDAGCQRNSIYFTDDFRRAYHYPKSKLGGHDTVFLTWRIEDFNHCPAETICNLPTVAPCGLFLLKLWF